MAFNSDLSDCQLRGVCVTKYVSLCLSEPDVYTDPSVKLERQHSTLATHCIKFVYNDIHNMEIANNNERHSRLYVF